jgi:hypothetical protein
LLALERGSSEGRQLEDCSPFTELDGEPHFIQSTGIQGTSQEYSSRVDVTLDVNVTNS